MTMNVRGIYKNIETELDLVSKKLKNISSSKHNLIADVVSHIIQNGKRVRPALTILIAKAFEIDSIEGVINSAFAVELIHTASLLHDDVVDGTKKRRGKKTANVLWGNKEVILVGDHLFTQAFLAISSLQNQQAIEIIANASHNLTVGEIVQLENEENIKIGFEKYLQVIYNKTASLFEASAMLGGVFAKNADVNLCKEFGKNIGIAFQMMDDILDYCGSAILNKDTGTDFRERKVTLPIIFLLNAVNSAEKKQIQGYFASQSAMEFDFVVSLMEKYGIFEKCNEKMQEYLDLARNFVKNDIKDSKMQSILTEFLDFFTQRQL